ncbi:MAG: cyanophycin synthetase [Candidatus Sumerlaeia bacterium]
MAKFTTLDEAYAWLGGQINYERNLGQVNYNDRTFEVEAFARRLESLGSPQRGLRAVHIAGTRGKGSAALTLEALLEAAGLKTAVFTSPHINEFRERIRIGRRPIAPELFCDLLGRIADMPRPEPAARSHGFKTVFELLTALFFLAAREAGVDFAIVETGLGGRLDATNVLDPGPVLLTRIGLEHTRLLGDTLGAIAGEKAAILKPGGWGVMGAQEESGAAEGVFRRRAAETGASLVSAAELCPLAGLRAHAGGLDLDFVFEGRPLAVRTKLLGPFQAENIQNGLAMLAALRARGIAAGLADDSMISALTPLSFPGRMQRAGAGPEWILDGGHCPTAAAALARAMEAHFGSEPAVALVGMMDDKDHRAFFSALTRWPGWRAAVCYRPPSPRALPAESLAAVAYQFFEHVEFYDDLEIALQKTVHLTDKKTRIVACGSLYGIGPILARVETEYGRTQTPHAPQAQPGSNRRDP